MYSGLLEIYHEVKSYDWSRLFMWNVLCLLGTYSKRIGESFRVEFVTLCIIRSFFFSCVCVCVCVDEKFPYQWICRLDGFQHDAFFRLSSAYVRVAPPSGNYRPSFFFCLRKLVWFPSVIVKHSNSHSCFVWTLKFVYATMYKMLSCFQYYFCRISP